MIDDIVVLPRTLTQFKREAKVSSDLVVSYPISAITREVGYEEPNDDDWVHFGNTLEVPTGKHAWFRFKIIENAANGIIEYFCLAESPLDFYFPTKSSKLKIYCPWMTITSRKDLTVKKFVLWRHIFELTRYEVEDSVVDAPIEAVIANEIKNFAMVYGCDHFMNNLQYYPQDYKGVLISEVHSNPEPSSLDKLLMLGANITAFRNNFDMMPFSFIDASDIWRGVDLPTRWTDCSCLIGCSVLPYLQFGSVTLSEIMHLFSPMYQMHAYQRAFTDKLLDKATILDIPTEDKKSLFTIIKYAEDLPYSEFELKVSRAGNRCLLRVFNPYNLDPLTGEKAVQSASLSNTRSSVFVRLFTESFPNMLEAHLARSWSEEIYITILNADGSSEKFYYDMSIATLCARTLIRDYNGSMFSPV